MRDLLEERVVWFVHHANLAGAIAGDVLAYRDGVAAVASALPVALGPEAMAAISNRKAELVGLGTGERCAGLLAADRALALAPDVVLIARGGDHSVVDVATTHFALARTLALGALATAMRGVPVADAYDRVALERETTTLARARRDLTSKVRRGAASGPAGVAAWGELRADSLSRARLAFDAMAATRLTVSMATVAAGLLDDLTSRRGPVT